MELKNTIMPQTTIKLSELTDWSVMGLATRAKIGSEFLHLSRIEKIYDKDGNFRYKVKFEYDIPGYRSLVFDQIDLPIDRPKYYQIEILLDTPVEAFWEDEAHEIDPVTKQDTIVFKEVSVILYYGNNIQIMINDKEDRVTILKKKDGGDFSDTTKNITLTIPEASNLIKDFNTIYNRHFK